LILFTFPKFLCSICWWDFISNFSLCSFENPWCSFLLLIFFLKDDCIPLPLWNCSLHCLNFFLGHFFLFFFPFFGNLCSFSSLIHLAQCNILTTWESLLPYLFELIKMTTDFLMHLRVFGLYFLTIVLFFLSHLHLVFCNKAYLWAYWLLIFCLFGLFLLSLIWLSLTLWHILWFINFQFLLFLFFFILLWCLLIYIKSHHILSHRLEFLSSVLQFARETPNTCFRTINIVFHIYLFTLLLSLGIVLLKHLLEIFLTLFLDLTWYQILKILGFLLLVLLLIDGILSICLLSSLSLILFSIKYLLLFFSS